MPFFVASPKAFLFYRAFSGLESQLLNSSEVSRIFGEGMKPACMIRRGLCDGRFNDDGVVGVMLRRKGEEACQGECWGY